MTGSIYRQAAIEALENERLFEVADDSDGAYERAITDCIQALAALPAVGGWLDIESAEIQDYEQNPPVLVHTAMGIEIANYALGNDGMYDWFVGSQCVTPTAWQPLPAPPEIE